MKNLKLFKVLFISIVGVMLISISSSVLAANDTGNTTYRDLTNEISGSGSTSTQSSGSSSTPGNKTPGNNTTGNNTTGNNVTTYNNNNNTANTLPYTGIGDTVLPVALLIVIFGISAVYAYKKVNDYKNI